MERDTNPAPVPLSGSLNLSAVSWQTRVSRAYFIPLPSVGFSLQSVPLAGIARPSRGRTAPLWLSTSVLDAASRVFHRRFPRRPRFHAVAWFPRRLWAPFPRTEARFPVTLDPSDGTRPFRQLHPLRSLDPPPSPFTPAWVAPNRRPILSWASAPLELSPSTPRVLVDPLRPRGPEHAPHPKDRSTAQRTLTPLEPGEAAPTPESTEATSLADSSPLRDWPAPPHRRRPFSLDLGAPGRDPSPLIFEALKCVESGVSPKRSPSLARSPASSPTS